MKITAQLIYFKQSGKYYSDGAFETDHKALYKIWNEVEEMLRAGKRPGLVDGPCEFFVLVNVPAHAHDHPQLITPDRLREICVMNERKKGTDHE